MTRSKPITVLASVAAEHAGGSGNTARDVRRQSWTDAFATNSAKAFGEAFADDVVLEASVLRRPVQGRDQVMKVMGTASGIYESLVFTHEASDGLRNYLEWEATAFGGTVLDGVTVLTKDLSGQIIRAAIHHRPLDGALRFSVELRTRLDGVIDPSHFYDGDLASSKTLRPRARMSSSGRRAGEPPRVGVLAGRSWAAVDPDTHPGIPPSPARADMTPPMSKGTTNVTSPLPTTVDREAHPHSAALPA